MDGSLRRSPAWTSDSWGGRHSIYRPGVDGKRNTVHPLSLPEPWDRYRTVGNGFKEASPSRWLAARWAAAALANLVGEDDRRRRTPGKRAVLRLWKLAGPKDAAEGAGPYSA